MRFTPTLGRRLTRHGLTPVVVAIVLITYANVFGNAWLFDDEFLVLKNTFLDSFANVGRILTSSSTAGAGFHDLFYRPTQGLAYLVVNQAFGRTPAAFHALNVGLHAVNAVLILHLGRRLRLGRVAAFAAALLWAVHPLHVEAVTYVSATADPLHALFVLVGLNVLVASRAARATWAAAACFVLGLLSKESAIVFPALFTAVIFARARDPFAWRAYRRTLPFWAIAALYVLLRRAVPLIDAGLNFYARPDAYADHALTRVWTALAALPAYAEILVWPHDLHMDRTFPTFTTPWSWAVMGGVGLVAGAGWLVLAAHRRPTRARALGAAAALWLSGRARAALGGGAAGEQRFFGTLDVPHQRAGLLGRGVWTRPRFAPRARGGHRGVGVRAGAKDLAPERSLVDADPILFARPGVQPDVGAHPSQPGHGVPGGGSHRRGLGAAGIDDSRQHALPGDVPHRRPRLRHARRSGPGRTLLSESAGVGPDVFPQRRGTWRCCTPRAATGRGPRSSPGAPARCGLRIHLSSRRAGPYPARRLPSSSRQ